MTNTAPANLPRETTYTGRWMVTKNPTNRSYGIGRAFAADLAGMREVEPGVEFTVWEFSGHTATGQRLFVRTRMVADAEGNVTCYDSEGRKIIRHPADREIRYLSRRA